MVAIASAGIDVFPDIINAALMAFVLSAAMTGEVLRTVVEVPLMLTLNPQDIYVASRCVYGLAKDGQAPRILARVLNNGNPIMAVVLSSLFVALGYLNATKSAATVFQYFVSLVTVFAVLNWIAILISFLSFRRALKAQGIQLQELPYVGFLQPFGSYFALFVSFTVLLFNGELASFFCFASVENFAPLDLLPTSATRIRCLHTALQGKHFCTQISRHRHILR